MAYVCKWYDTLTRNWRAANSDETFKRFFFANFLVCFIVHYCIVYWLTLNSSRPGPTIDDPVYNLLTPHDFSIPIFFFTYTAVITFLLHIAQYPLLIHRAFTAFVSIFAVRALCIYLIPLSPSPGIIVLTDPMTNALAHESNILNDLFFSGHIADLSLFFLLSRSISLKRYIALCIAIVGTLLIWQRVHYTIDVLAAPFFAYAGYWIFVEKDIIWSSYLKKPEFVQNEDCLSES